MAEIERLSRDEERVIQRYLPTTAANRASRPFVTVTYACSMDGMISLAPGVQTSLSGPKSLSMTHYLRMHHEALLIGVETAISDDPSLNCRYSGRPRANLIKPVIVDSRLRWDVQAAKMTRLANEGVGNMPLIIHAEEQKINETRTECCSEATDEGTDKTMDESMDEAMDEGAEEAAEDGMTEGMIVDSEHMDTKEPESSSTPSDFNTPQPRQPDPKVEYLGLVPTDEGNLLWQDIFRALKNQGINSVMVEGGARVINSLLAEPNLIDSVIVTKAPVWLGKDGVLVSPEPRYSKTKYNKGRVKAAVLKDPSWIQLGDDAVTFGRFY